jgi:hypothetical protein
MGKSAVEKWREAEVTMHFLAFFFTLANQILYRPHLR